MKRQYQIEQQRAVQQFRRLATEENPNIQMILPLAEIVGLLQQGVGNLLRETGLALMQTVMEEEVRHLAGERYQQHEGRRAHRWGKEDVLQTLIARGDTWSTSTNVAEDLITFFINPVLMQAGHDLSEPDNQPIEEWQARSAILFGPPGASKTTLARLMAASLKWKYVELHSSHFVAEGIQAIQSTADRIFRQLMELDHAVILFDEPDELVREREDSSDAFGRFLTTSMLPKLAELWKQRRVIYFIATNHIRYFDAAIVRSERFDLLALTLPPSFDRKKDALQSRLRNLTGRAVSITVSKEDIEKQLEAVDAVIRKKLRRPPEAELAKKDQLAKFILLRWDQIDELAFHLQQNAPLRGKIVVTRERLSDALHRIVDHRLGLLATYGDYLRDSKQARRDFQRKPVFELKNLPEGAPLPPNTVRLGDHVWHRCESGTCPEQLGSYRVSRTPTPGVLEIKKV